jgi:hypothetical protein
MEEGKGKRLRRRTMKMEERVGGKRRKEEED